MTLLDILNSAWAIEPGKHAQLREIYAAHVRGEKIDIAAVEASLGRPLAREQQGYTVENGVAVIPIDVQAVLEGRETRQNIQLRPYDSVFVPASPIADMNRWVDQYIRQNIPFSFGLDFQL